MISYLYNRKDISSGRVQYLSHIYVFSKDVLVWFSVVNTQNWLKGRTQWAMNVHRRE